MVAEERRFFASLPVEQHLTSHCDPNSIWLIISKVVRSNGGKTTVKTLEMLNSQQKVWLVLELVNF